MIRPGLYKVPFIVAGTLLGIGLLGTFNLAYLPIFFNHYNGMTGGYAFMVIGIFIVIAALITFAVYGRLNIDYKRMLSGEVLLSYLTPIEVYNFYSRKEADAIRGGNIMALLMVLIFCVLFGIIFGITMDSLFFVIFFGIAAFFTAVYFATTIYRTKKVRKSQALVCLSLGGAYIFGHLHNWSINGSRPVAADFFEIMPDNAPCPLIQITYLAAAYPTPQQQTITIPILPQMAEQAIDAVRAIKNAYGI